MTIRELNRATLARLLVRARASVPRAIERIGGLDEEARRVAAFQGATRVRFG